MSRLRLAIAPASIELWDGEALLAAAAADIDDGSASFWATAAAACAGLDRLDTVLSPPDTHSLRVATRPGGLGAALRQAPLTPDRLAWSAVFRSPEGGHMVVIVRHARLASIAAVLVAKGLPPARFIDDRGTVIGAPARANAGLTGAALAVALLSLTATAAIGIRPPPSAPRAVAAPALLPAEPTLAATLVRIVGDLPADAALVSVARAPDGDIRVVIASPDPDRLRVGMRAAPRLRRLREETQSATEDGRLRITYVGRLA